MGKGKRTRDKRRNHGPVERLEHGLEAMERTRDHHKGKAKFHKQRTASLDGKVKERKQEIKDKKKELKEKAKA